VLGKRIKLTIRSIKEHGWALCVKVGSLEGLPADWLRHKNRSTNYQKLQGVMCKSTFLLPQDTGGRPWTGAPVQRRRRRHGRRGGRRRTEIGRGERGESLRTLTCCGFRRETPVLEVNPADSVWRRR
jgi:hypothetical protein